MLGTSNSQSKSTNSSSSIGFTSAEAPYGIDDITIIDAAMLKLLTPVKQTHNTAEVTVGYEYRVKESGTYRVIAVAPPPSGTTDSSPGAFAISTVDLDASTTCYISDSNYGGNGSSRLNDRYPTGRCPIFTASLTCAGDRTDIDTAWYLDHRNAIVAAAGGNISLSSKALTGDYLLSSNSKAYMIIPGLSTKLVDLVNSHESGWGFAGFGGACYYNSRQDKKYCYNADWAIILQRLK